MKKGQRSTVEYKSQKVYDLLGYIAAYIAERKYAPSRREMAASCNTSTSVINYYLKRLVEEGYLTVEFALSRCIVLTQKGVNYGRKHNAGD